MSSQDNEYFLMRFLESQNEKRQCFNSQSSKDFILQKVKVNLVHDIPHRPWSTIQEISETSETIYPKDFLSFKTSAKRWILVPGYFDSHLHVLGLGKKDLEIDLSSCLTPQSILEKINLAMSTHPGIQAIVGFGWDESRFGMEAQALGDFLEKSWTEKIPVFLKRHCRHSAFVNKFFRKRINRSDLPNWIHDEHLGLFWEALPTPAFSESEEHFLKAQKKLLEAGISGVGDMSQDEHSVHVVKNLANQGRLHIDVLGVFDIGKTPTIENSGPIDFVSNQESPYLGRPAVYSVRFAKRYIDGSLGSHSALLSEPYSDKLNHYGVLLEPLSALIESSREMLMRGFLLSFHALGDGAIDQVIAIEKALRPLLLSRVENNFQKYGQKLLHRIEHAQVMRNDQIDFFQKSQLWSFHLQPLHRVTDSSFSLSRLGESRLLNWGYRARSFWENNIEFCLGSDAPIDIFDPDLSVKSSCEHPNLGERLSKVETLWHSSLRSRLICGQKLPILKPGSRVIPFEV
jgi:predicted amidohydrolase YtcJ